MDWLNIVQPLLLSIGVITLLKVTHYAKQLSSTLDIRSFENRRLMEAIPSETFNLRCKTKGCMYLVSPNNKPELKGYCSVCAHLKEHTFIKDTVNTALKLLSIKILRNNIEQRRARNEQERIEKLRKTNSRPPKVRMYRRMY